MMDSAMVAILARTYFHTVTAYRPTSEDGEKRLCEAAQCALSRSAHTSCPHTAKWLLRAPGGGVQAFPVHPPGVGFPLGRQGGDHRRGRKRLARADFRQLSVSLSLCNGGGDQPCGGRCGKRRTGLT